MTMRESVSNDFEMISSETTCKIRRIGNWGTFLEKKQSQRQSTARVLYQDDTIRQKIMPFVISSYI